MKYVAILVLITITGCVHHEFDTIVKKPVSEWSAPDCLTIMSMATSNNFANDDARVRVIVTPFSPLVVTAFTRLQQERQRLSAAAYHSLVEDRLLEDLGIYYDTKTGYTFDARGNYYRDEAQIDSLLILLSLENKTYPCTPPIVMVPIGKEKIPKMRQLMNVGDYPCYTPEITDLEKQIFLKNEKDELLQPRGVYGKRGKVFFKREQLLLLFSLRQGEKNFFDGSKRIYLTINELDGGITMEIPLETFKSYTLPAANDQE
ncbi:MAG: hypothetical protein EPO24_05415 [Bacteroidetes bacterium]|nr:MAG: hypothetical protein EPO24_05415 [Bacteroidota bacterium]